MSTDLLLCFHCMQPLAERTQTCPHCGHDNHIRTNGPGMLSEYLLQNQYLVGQALGRGGFGITYIGYDINLEQRVAIKEYYPSTMVTRGQNESRLTAISGSEESYQRGLQRALKESRMAAQLRGIPGVVQTYNVFTANNTVYIIMEYVEGQTLNSYVEALSQKLTVKQAAWLLAPVAGALEELHSQNVIHRDVKPDNIMVRTKDRRCVLLDFGAARTVDDSTLSNSAAVVSAGYAPIEQYNLSSMDGRIDQYALAATLLYTLTGQRPPDVLQRVAMPECMPALRNHNPSVNQAAEKAILKGMALKAEERYPTISSFWAAFSGESVPGRVPVSSEPGKGPEKSKRSKAPAIIGAIAAVAVAVGGLLYFMPPSAPSVEADGAVPAGSQTAAVQVQENEALTNVSQSNAAPTAASVIGQSIPTAAPATTVAAATATPEPEPTPTPFVAPAITPEPDLTVTREYTSGDWELGILRNGTAMITGYTGEKASLQIPTAIDGYTVSAIGPSAFGNNAALTDAVIPEGITTIGSKAFNLCSNLRSVTIADSVVNVGGGVFASCPSLTELHLSAGHPALALEDGVLINHQARQLLWYPSQRAASTYQIPEGIVSIGDHAFTVCKNLTGISIPATVTAVGKGVFVDSSKLTQFTVAAGNPVLSVENGSLYDQREMELICCPAGLSEKTYQIPEGTRTIRASAFHRCNDLSSIIIPNSVTRIMDQAFAFCSGLSEIDIPDSVTSMGASVFSSCSSLSRVKLSAGMTEISSNTFRNCYALSQVEIPEGISAIGSSAFHLCTSLTGITLPTSLTTIGKTVFAKCSSLLRIDIPDNVTSIGENCFSSCSALQTVTLPASDILIGKDAFYNCPNVELDRR